MRTDVKVGLFVGIAALLLVGYFLWPETPQAIPVGGTTGTVAGATGAGQPAVADRATPVTPPTSMVQTPAMPTVRPGEPAVVRGNEPIPSAPAASGMTETGGANQPLAVAGPVPAPVPPVEPAPVAPTALTTPTAAPVVPAVTETATATPATGVAATAREPEPMEHLVRPGDTLEKVAAFYYDNAALAGALRQYNSQIGSATRLKPGTKLKIPAETVLHRLAQAPASTTPLTPGAPSSPSLTTMGQPMANGPASQPAELVGVVPAAREYTVRKGDTLYSIAAKHLGSGSRWQELMDLNSEKLRGSPRNLRPGQVLRLSK